MGNRPRVRRAFITATILIAATSLGATGATAQFDVNRLFDFGNKLYQGHLEQQQRQEEELRRQREQALPQPQYPQQQYPRQQVPQQQVRHPPPSAAPDRPAPTGPTRADVRAVQDRLNRLGYDAGPADGLMGPRTARAIEAFQHDNRLPASGAVTDDLVALLQETPAQDAASNASPPPQVGPGIVPVEAVHQDGHLLTGYPLLFGSHRTGETAMLGPRRSRSHVELSRVLDLLILAARPTILDDQLVARNYAVRFLTEEEQARFLADCPYRSCGGSKIPFVGWIGSNEFEREATYRRFVSEFRDRLVALAPTPPPPLLHIVEMDIGAYDGERESFPLDVRRGDIIIATVPPAYGLNIGDDFARPTAIPVPRAEGGAFLARVPERRAYLALKGTLTPFSDSRFGKRLDTTFAVQSAAVYADPDLRDELYSFGLFSEGGKAVAAAQTSGQGGSGANGMRALTGPGGEAILELALPEGLKPIRFMALHGLPVTGAPVRGRGPLSPGTLKRLHGHAPEVETEVDRIVSLMRLADQPKLLEGLTYAEDFINTHADADTYAHFHPEARMARGTFHNSFGNNQFERADLHRELIRRYADAAFPKAPFELLHVEDIRLRSYDSGTGRYGLSDPSGGGSGIGPTVEKSGFMPDSFPIAPAAAQALIDRIPDGKIYIAYHVALTGGPMGGRRNTDVTVDLRGLSLYEDELLSKPLHTFEVDTEQTPRPTLPPMAHLSMHLASLYEVRDIKGWMSDKALLEGAARLVQTEQRNWPATDTRGGISSGRCYGGKMTVFEWDRARRDAPALANGPLLDALIGVPMDWQFLNDHTRFGLVPDHCVAVHVFPRERIEGREPEFAARDVLDIYRASIEAAAARAPRTVYIRERLPEPRYDHASGELFFPPESESDRDKGKEWSMRALSRITTVAPQAEAGNRPSSRVAYVPPGMEGHIFYRLGSIGDTDTIGDNGVKPTPLGQGQIGKMWRQTVWSVRDDRPRRILALDRVLDTPRLPMPAAQAEKIVASRDSLTGIITLDIDHAQASPANGGSMIVTRLRDVKVMGKDGSVIATVPASAFTSGQAVVSAARQKEQAEAAEAAAKRAAEETLEAKRAALLDGHKGTVLIRRAGTESILKAYHTGGSAGIGYTHTVRNKALDMPVEGIGLVSKDMADKLRSEDGAALVVNVGVFSRSVFPDVADLDLVVEDFPPEPKPLEANLAAALNKQLPEDAKVVLLRPAGDNGAMETVYTTTSHTESAHLNWKLKLGTAPDYATVEEAGTPQETSLRDVPDLLRNARNAGVLMEPDGLRAIFGQISDLKPTIVRFPMAEYGFGLERDHTATAADYDILGIAGGAPEAVALEAIAQEFKPEEVHRDDTKGEILARRGACDGPLTAPPAPGQEGAYCLRVRLDGGTVSSVTLRQVLPGAALEVAENAFKERYGWSHFVKETRYFPGNGQRILVGYGKRLHADRQDLGRVAAGTPPTALETIAWTADDMTAVLLHLDTAATPQEAQVEAENKIQPKLKF